MISVLKFVFVFQFNSPSGKLVQIEYALAAVAAGASSVGIKGKFPLVLNIIIFLTISFVYLKIL